IFDVGRIAGSVALFSTSQPRAFINAQNNTFSAAGDDRHRGVEANISGIAAHGLRVLGGVTYLDAEQQSTGDANTDGRRAIGVPRWQANLGGEYDLPFVPELSFDARVLYTGASEFDAANTLRVDGWTRLDLGARYLLPVGSRLLTLRARVDNVTNENYWASSGGYPGAGYLVVGTPRTFNLSAAMDF
ncbi:MAG: TonB-dependent receptor domain-containing protein, partial [Nevskiales bacterium]